MSELVQQLPAVPVPRPARPLRRVRRGTYFGPRFWMAVIVAASALWIVLAEPKARVILAPALTMVDAAAIFILVLYRRDRRLPVFEVGTLWVFVTLIYSVFPLLNFYVGGLQWTMFSDSRLQGWGPDAYETGAFAWRYVVYLLPFTIAYLLVRGRAHVTHTKMNRVSRSRVVAVIIVFVACKLVLVAVARVYGISYNPSYADLATQSVDTLAALPLILQQVIHWFVSYRLLLLQMLLIIAMQRWRDWRYRIAIFAFLAFQIGLTLYVRGARTELTLLLITAVLMYHRLVRPLTLKVAIPAAAGLLLAFNLLGLLRDSDYMRVVRSYGVPSLATVNEFQIVWGTSYDIYMRKQLGVLGPVPRQLPFSDLYFMVPSQLLPFEKIDPAIWYMSVAGYDTNSGGLMFGVVSHAILGYDWKELIARSILLGVLAALLHRWYVKRAERFWPMVLYMFICIWTYYGMRQSSFAILSFLEYEFVPVFLGVELTSVLLRGAHRRARGLMRA